MTDGGLLRVPADGPALGSEADATDLIGQTWGTSFDTVVVPVERLHPEFLVLSSRMLGGFTQKFAQYGTRLALLGDVSAAAPEGSALADYIRETNRGDLVWFVPDEAALVQKLLGSR